MTDRNKRLVEFYKRGFSMREVASQFKISVQRVQQILRMNAPQLIRPIGDRRNNSTGKHRS